jgi:hypothetical protein
MNFYVQVYEGKVQNTEHTDHQKIKAKVKTFHHSSERAGQNIPI